jgi:hypothetical protein
VCARNVHQGIAVSARRVANMQLRFNKIDLLLRMLGVLFGVFGLVVICAAAASFYDMLPTRPAWDILLFGVIFSLLMLALGVYAISVAVRLWRPLTASIIRQVCGLLSFVLCMQLAMWLEQVPETIHRLSARAWDMITFGTAVMLTAVLYVVLSRWLIARSTVVDKTRRPVSKQLIGLVCIVLWINTSTLVEELAPKAPGHSNVPVGPWLLISLFGPILFAIVVYGVAVHYAYSLPGLPFIGPPLDAARRSREAVLHQERITLFQCPACAYDLRQSLADGREVCPECEFELASTTFPQTPAAST